MSSILTHSKFFKGVMALFLLQSAWIALSGAYPMPFDEDYHLGLIRLYAHHLSPFLGGQPAGADVFGAVTRDTSYLYHYLMSFPYRLIAAFTDSQAIQVLILRGIDIALFAWGLVLFRRLLLKTGISEALVNLCLLIFVLIPVVPQLAGQINYDNLIFPLAALSLLWAVRLGEGMEKKRLDGRLLLGLASLCLLTSLVKYAYLPVFLAIVLYLVVRGLKAYGNWKGLFGAVAGGLKKTGSGAGLALAAIFLVSLLLFAQRYGVNIVRYHTPVPACDKVMSVSRCRAYGPWARDHRYQLSKSSTNSNPVFYTGDWLYGMWLRLFFALAGPTYDYQTRGPLLVPGMAAVVFTVAGAAAVAVYGRRVFLRYDTGVMDLLALAALLYVGALWLDEYLAYVRTGQPVAINGRYLLPVLPFLILLGISAMDELLAARGRLGAKARPYLAILPVICLLWGGGALTYILRSNDAWYWDSRLVRGANHAVQSIAGPVTPGYRHPVEFLR